MNDTASKWLAGCGIGCVVIVFGLVLFGFLGYYAVQDTVEDFRDVGVTLSELEEAYGAPDDFVPWAGGELPAPRIEAFLSVRLDFAETRLATARTIGELDQQVREMEKSGASFLGVLRAIRSGVGSIPELALFHKGRAQALLSNEMGLGEYQYLYVTVFYGWLGKSPEDGPAVHLMGDHDSSKWEEESNREGTAAEQRGRQLTALSRRLLIPMLRASITQPEEGPARHTQWYESVQIELEKLVVDPDRLPWQDGVPSSYAKSLEPFRQRLEASYDALLNPLELTPVHD